MYGTTGAASTAARSISTPKSACKTSSSTARPTHNTSSSCGPHWRTNTPVLFKLSTLRFTLVISSLVRLYRVGWTKETSSSTHIPVTLCMACTRSSGCTSVPPLRHTFLISDRVYKGNNCKLVGKNCPSSRFRLACAQHLTTSVHVPCNRFRATSNPLRRPTETACFASKVTTGSHCIPPRYSCNMAVTGTACVHTRIRRSALALVYKSALCIVKY
mmetsp:Transcript_3622/g.5275  ORF Transcript_3622/g.5275 Transcript_3622/m.5275 type:complete len:216 (+) Transcript_3622:807-1454(+)